jgi:histidine triad (HIT) family protein
VTATCIFCRIAGGEAPASMVYEDADIMAFLDLHPVHAGHTLVAPRAHAVDVRDCAPALAARLFEVSARLAPVVVRATNADGFNIWTAAGRAAGQTVFHVHLHILPRFSGDEFGLRLPKGGPPVAARSDLDAVAERIRRFGGLAVWRLEDGPAGRDYPLGALCIRPTANRLSTA